MGVYLSEPNRQKNHSYDKRNHLAYVSGQMQGWRKNMQDACIHQLDLGDGNALFAVFDGHGGFQISRYVSNVFEKQLKNNKAYKQKSWTKALDQVFKKVDEMIISPQGQKQIHKIRYSGDTKQAPNNAQPEMIGGGTGCTANVILITPTQYIVANAGDSRSVLSRGGKAMDLSKDHKPESPEQEARVKGAGGSIVMGRVNGGLNLTRSFGDFDYKQNKELSYDKQMITCKPDIVEYKRQAQDEFILLGCDGIWEKYLESTQPIIEIVQQKIKKEPKQLISQLLDSLLAEDTTSGIGCDNMSAIVIYLKE